MFGVCSVVCIGHNLVIWHYLKESTDTPRRRSSGQTLKTWTDTVRLLKGDDQIKVKGWDSWPKITPPAGLKLKCTFLCWRKHTFQTKSQTSTLWRLFFFLITHLKGFLDTERSDARKSRTAKSLECGIFDWLTLVVGHSCDSKKN